MALNIADLAEHAIDAVPDRIALIGGDQHLTYAQLEEKANRLAHYLIDNGVNIDVVTPEMLTRMPSAPKVDGREVVAIPHSDLWPNIIRTAHLYVWLAQELNAPIYMAGAYRPPDYNKAVTCEEENAAGQCTDWSENSAHQWFSSMDISAAAEDKHRLDILGAQLYLSQPRIGFGVYGKPGSIHIDTGSNKRKWKHAKHYIDLVRSVS